MNPELLIHIAGYIFMDVMALYLLYDLFTNEMECRFVKKSYYVLMCLPIIAINTITAICLGSSWRSIISPIFLIALMLYYFLGSSGTKVILGIIYFIVRSVAEGLSALPFSIFQNNKNTQTSIWSWLLVVLFAQMMFFSFLKVAKIFWSKKKNRVLDWRMLFILFLPIATMLIIWYAEGSAGSGTLLQNISLGIAIVLLIVSNFAVVSVVERVTILMQEHREYEMVQLKDEMEKNYYLAVEEMNHKQTVYRHDIKHCLQALSMLAAENQTAQIRTLLGEMQEEIEELTPKTYTNSSIFNAVLTEKEALANKKSIQFQVEVEPSVDLSFVKETDIICMFGNLLDNAIRGTDEYLIQNPKKRVDASTIVIRLFETEGNFVLFDVCNYFSGELNVEHGEYLTTKLIKEGHGLGLKSVKKMVEKYGGVLDISAHANMFTTTITLAHRQ